MFVWETRNYPWSFTMKVILKIGFQWDFLGGSVAKNPPANAGDTGLAPGWGTKIPRAAEQLSSTSCDYWSPCAATRELTRYNGRTKTQNIQIHKIKKKKSSFPPCRERHTGNQKEHPYKTLESHGILQFDFQKWRHQEPQRAEQLISQVLKAPPTRLQHWVSSMTSDFV